MIIIEDINKLLLEFKPFPPREDQEVPRHQLVPPR
jgi:hypothetical protein